MSARTLIVGASSPLGTAVAGELTRAGERPALAARRGPIALDVTDAASVAAVLAEGYERIVYLANPATVDAPTAERYLLALADFAGRAQRTGTRRIVFASSAAVYGTASPEPRAETSPLAGGSAYALLKAESERVLRGVSSASLSVVALRIFNAYGPGASASLVNRLADPAERPRLQVSARFVRDYIHVDDVARAFRAALDADLDGFTAINAGTGRGVSTAHLAELFPAGSYEPVPAGEDTFSVAAVERAETLLGFRAHRRVEDFASTPGGR